MGVYKKTYLFKSPKNHDIVFTLIVFSGGELPVDKKWVWKHPWSRVNGCHLLFSFPFITFHFAFISSHVPFILHSFHVILHSFPFILLSCPFMFRRYVSKIQVFESWYAQTGHVGIHPNTPFFCICRSVIVELSFWRPVQVAIFRFHEHVHV